MSALPRYLVALITPFTSDGTLDVSAHRHNVSVLADAGVNGFALGGSNGEGPYLETGERRELLTSARGALGTGAHLMCGLMAETVREASRQLEEAAQGGADSVLCLTPTTLTRNRPDAVERYFTAVADSSPLPVMLYSVPNTTAYNLEEASVSRLATHPNIVGMKDSSGDPVRMQRLVESTPEGFTLWSGSSQALTLALTAGAHGVITGSGNYVPTLVLDTLEAASDDPHAAHATQTRLSAVSRAVESHGIPGVKAASEAAGLRAGYPRLPLVPVPDHLASELRQAVLAI
ncbi:MAG TPA: dihydrodipicolinate synthase family protein [Acidimicrobiia bacterium]|nr:dihydrodipicolinate synthase family protein [Acidimicrobiia bacterium]